MGAAGAGVGFGWSGAAWAGWVGELAKAIADLGDGVAQGEEAIEQDGACEVEGIARGVEVPLQDRRAASSEGQRDGGEVEAGGLRGRIWAALAGRTIGGWRGVEQESAQRDGFGAERGELQGFF